MKLLRSTHRRDQARKCGRNRASKLRGRETDQNTEITVCRKLRRTGGIGPQDVAMFGAALCVADHALSGEVRWEDLPVRDFVHDLVHFRDPGKASDMPKLDDRWNLRLWLGKSLASD